MIKMPKNSPIIVAEINVIAPQVLNLLYWAVKLSNVAPGFFILKLL
jgi:hypothetical protein